MKTLIAALTLSLTALCTHAASELESPAPELGEVWTAKQEDEAKKVAEETMELLIKTTEASDFVRRDAHPKTHGCVKAFLKVDPSQLKTQNQAGLFKQAAEYSAWIRFSNGAQGGAKKSDLEGDVRGIAIKLMNVPFTPKGSYDFLMANNREFFAEDGKDYQKLVTALTSGTASVLAYLATHWTNAARLNSARVKIGSPLETEYNSAVPYKLGNQAMRMRLVPCFEKDSGIPAEGVNYLGQRLASSLKESSACFHLYVQPNNELKKQPVEDPRIVWNETKSPLIKVGTLTLPHQDEINTPERINFCENLSFNPWNTLPGSRPLGQINRIRSVVYKEISRFRHEKNRIPEIEPTDHSACKGQAKELCASPKL